MKRSRGFWAGIVAALIAAAVWAASIFTGHPLGGTGSAPPTAKWYPTSTEFGAVEVGTAVDATVRLKNVGKAGTLQGTVALAPGCSAVFTIVSGGGAYALPPGQSRTVIVRFAPTDTSAVYACTLSSGP